MFTKGKFNSIFKENTYPDLISVYQATGKYTEMPRAMHSHESTVELILITEGYGIHIIDGKKYYTEKGDLLILNAGVLHDESSAGTNLCIATCALQNLSIRDFETNTLTGKNQNPILKTDKDFSEVKKLFFLMYNAVSMKDYSAEEYSNYLLRALLVLICGIIRKNSDHDYTKDENKLAQKIKKYMDIHYTENLKLNMLAGYIHVNTYYLSHIFKKVYGQSPMQYVMRRRIGEAQTLLIDTRKNITDIAMTVGYNSQSYFNGIFVKITGLPPRKYRMLYSKI
ncbi:AraC family transcriptional regulator [Pectinatus haikarae]|uniref:AraC-like DNA-binding protein/mannose-6-phosphate isomerase-like protein (Cupin superfamily) n=1 Tax=Pectinatus haikarae TaxID=349096 RepID=A0ABT9Y8N4_9FIRM|nr:AraC family transcriptional regulator [Pectinatus haikarae]MDQ0204167.1 AraC-like DNA-binding protein/mannose-6-phosphate isomerase-like protein (cupin superfamily) [Pectinatus haikarae]